MSRKDRETWQTLLDADPALRTAWETFNGELARVSDRLTQARPRDVETIRHDLACLRGAARRVQFEAGEDEPRH